MDDSQKEDVGPVSFVPNAEVTAVLEELLTALPHLRKPDRLLAGLGLPRQLADRLALPAGGITAGSLATLLLPRLEPAAWAELEPALRQVTAAPERHALTLAAVQEEGPWRRAALAVLGSPGFKLTSGQQTMASLAGLGELVVVWRHAQQERLGREEGPGQHGLSQGTERMLEAAVKLVEAGRGREEEALDSLMHSLKLAGLVTPGGNDEYTWYKLVEWLQVGPSHSHHLSRLNMLKSLAPTCTTGLGTSSPSPR
jgi:hypothetical protein